MPATATSRSSITRCRPPSCGTRWSAASPRQVRYRCFDAPLIVAERARIQQELRAELDRLSPDPEARAAQIDAMVASGEPLLGVFTERHHAAMLEVMTRRYYRIRPLAHIRITEHDGRPLLTTEYAHDGHDYLVVATVAGGTNADRVTDLHRLVDALPADRTALIDLYVTSEADGDAAPDDRAGLIRDKLGTIPANVGRSSSPCAEPTATRAAARPGSPSAARPAGIAALRWRRWRTGPCAACTPWSPSGWTCGGCRDSS